MVITILFIFYPILCFSAHPVPLGYTAIYNLLNFPAGVVPVTTVTAEDEEELAHYEGLHRDHWDKLYKQVNATVGQCTVNKGPLLTWPLENIIHNHHYGATCDFYFLVFFIHVNPAPIFCLLDLLTHLHAHFCLTLSTLSTHSLVYPI